MAYKYVMTINQSDFFELLISEATYKEFIEFIEKNPHLLENNTIKTASVLKIIGRRPLLYHIIIKAITERGGMTLSEIYQHIKENYGDEKKKKMKSGSGLTNYLKHLEIIGILDSQEKGKRIKWLPSNNNITLDISSTKYLTTEHPGFEQVINSKLDLKIQLNDQSDDEDFDPKRLLQSLIKSDIKFDEATQILYKLTEKLKTYNSPLFNWNEIPGFDDEKLIEILKNDFNIDWVRDAKFEKIDDNRTLKVSFDTRNILLKLNDEENEISLEIDGKKKDNFIVKSENGILYIHNRIKKIRKTELIEIITNEMSNSNLNFEPIYKFKNLVMSTSPYGVYIQDINDSFYYSLSYEKINSIALEVINEMLKTENITVNKIREILLKINSDKNLEQNEKRYWSQKNVEYISSIDNIEKKYKEENINVRKLNIPEEREKAIKKMKNDKELELDEIKNDFLINQLSEERLKKFKLYIIGKKEFDNNITRNVFLILKKMGFKYIDSDFAKVVIKQYIYEREIIRRDVQDPKKYAVQQFNSGREFYELASLFNHKDDIVNGSLNALLALNDFYSILFFAFNKIGSSAMFFALTKMSTEIFADKVVTDKLKEYQVYSKYQETMLYIKNNTLLSTVIQKGGCEDENFTKSDLNELLIHTYKIMKVTDKFIDGYYPNQN